MLVWNVVPILLELTVKLFFYKHNFLCPMDLLCHKKCFVQQPFLMLLLLLRSNVLKGLNLRPALWKEREFSSSTSSYRPFLSSRLLQVWPRSSVSDWFLCPYFSFLLFNIHPFFLIFEFFINGDSALKCVSFKHFKSLFR